MVNTALFKMQLVKKGFSQREFCRAAGFNLNTFNAKLNNKGYFNTQEIETSARVLGLNSETDANLLCDIFLSSPSQ